MGVCVGMHRCSLANCCIFIQAKSKDGAHCNTLKHIATHRNTLQHTASHRNTLQHLNRYRCARSLALEMQQWCRCLQTPYNQLYTSKPALQCVEVCCSVSQCATVCRSALQCATGAG